MKWVKKAYVISDFGEIVPSAGLSIQWHDREFLHQGIMGTRSLAGMRSFERYGHS
jgi:hypothetical protein